MPALPAAGGMTVFVAEPSTCHFDVVLTAARSTYFAPIVSSMHTVQVRPIVSKSLWGDGDREGREFKQQRLQSCQFHTLDLT